MNQPSKSQGIFWGWLLIGVGVLFLLHKLDVIDIGDLFSTFWPLILIAIGVKILLGRRDPMKKDEHGNGSRIIAQNANVNETRVFGDLKVTVESREFKGGNVSAVFCDTMLDLSNIALAAEGETVVTLNGVFGDMLIIVPRDVAYAIRANVIIGDINLLGTKNDGFFINQNSESPGYNSATKKLYISASQVIGDIVARTA